MAAKGDISNEEAVADTSASHSKIVEYECRLDCMFLKFITSASEIRVVSIELYRGVLTPQS